MKTGIVDVGGGLRGVYAAGVFDYCMEQKIHFDCCIGVSAGSANVASYLAGQKGRNFRFYCDYAFRREYMGFGNLLHKGSYIDMEYVYGELSNSDGEYPLDYDALQRNPAEMLVVTEEAKTGAVRYFDKSYVRQDDYRVFMASSSIPGVNQPYEIDGVPYYDGALADPVPIRKAFDMGCDRVVLILTKPVDVLRTPDKDPVLARMIQHRYPASAERLRSRATLYNASVALAKDYERQGKALIIAPDNTAGVNTLTREKSALWHLYGKGCRDGEKILQWLS